MRAVLSVWFLGGAAWLTAGAAHGSPAGSEPIAKEAFGFSVLGKLDPHEALHAVRAGEADAVSELRWHSSQDLPQGAGRKTGAKADAPAAIRRSAQRAAASSVSAAAELSYAAGRSRGERRESRDQADSGEQEAVRQNVRSVLDFYRRRLLNTRENNCWELMHAIVALGVESQVRQGGAKGRAVNSIAWLCSGASCAGQPLMYLDRGRPTAAKGPRVQGHHGQFLAILAQSKVMSDYPILVGGRSFTVADLIETEKLSCVSQTELTFKLIAFAHYLDADAAWKNRQGEDWSIERLIREEIGSPINGAPCGGTHRLMGLSYAVHERIKQGQPVDGEFLRAQTYVDDFHRYAFRLQNPDGSFSTDWFKGRAAKADLDRRLQTTGHILEWLAYSVPDAMLDDPRFIKSVSYLAGILDAERDRNWSVGPLGHGLHALAIYDERMQRIGRQEPAADIARRDSMEGRAPSPAKLMEGRAPSPAKLMEAPGETSALEYSPAAEPSQPVIVPVSPRRLGSPRLGHPRAEAQDEFDRD
ncbi:MAG TPA: hypothetical protein VMV10_30495 [Pirellulales bacterium]|nr:hypothetical protein [Pirellulales bacterium]